MNQSTKIVGFITAAFVVFITVRGELPTYLSFLLGTAASPSAPPGATGSIGGNAAASAGSGSSSSVASNLGTAIQIGSELAAFA